MIECKCKGCKRHSLHCKRDCLEWKEFQNQIKKARELRHKEIAIYAYQFDQVSKSKEISRRKKYHRRKVR